MADREARRLARAAAVDKRIVEGMRRAGKNTHRGETRDYYQQTSRRYWFFMDKAHVAMEIAARIRALKKGGR